MSIETDLASIQIIAAVHKNQNLQQSFFELVHRLQKRVSYIDWVGIYLLEGNKMNLEAASDFEDLFVWECNSELRIPIKNHLQESIGKIVLKSRRPICFDLTDLSTLEVIAQEIGSKLYLN